MTFLGALWLVFLSACGGAVLGAVLLVCLFGGHSVEYLPGWLIAIILGVPGGAILGAAAGIILAIIRWQRSRS